MINSSISPLSTSIVQGLSTASPKLGQTSSLASAFSKKLNEVDKTMKQSSNLKTLYELGDPNVSLPEVMIASQKSKIALATTIELRNKGLEAYKDLINMPV